MPSPELIVVERMTWQRRLGYICLALILLVIVGMTGFFVGNQDGISLRSEKASLENQVQALTEQLTDTKKQLVMLNQLKKVDQEANRQAGSSLDYQQQKIRELERELEFFRSILAPEEADKGLKISRFKWQKSEDGNLGWQLSLIQAGSQGATISGTVAININVLRNNAPETIIVVDESGKERFNYRFRYFQHINGSLAVDPEVKIISADIKVMPSVKGQQIISQQFQWPADEEKVANVE
jgi:hypothetical protein